jgi:hypothetical protein
MAVFMLEWGCMANLVEEGNVEGEAELILEPDLVRELIAELASRRRRIGQQRLDTPKNNLVIFTAIFFRKKPLFIKKVITIPIF